MKILVINASLSGSKTAKAINSLKFSKDFNIEYVNLKDLEMSFADGRDFREYNNDNELIVKKMIDADAIIIATPIFQASIPGVLKNVFDLLPVNAIANKTVGTIITAGSSRHYLVAQQQLNPILNYLKTDLVNKYVFIEASDFNGDEISEDITIRIESLVRVIEDRVYYKKKEEKAKYSFL